MTNTKDQKWGERKIRIGLEMLVTFVSLHPDCDLKAAIDSAEKDIKKILSKEIAKAEKKMIRDFRAELKASLYQQREEMGEALRMEKIEIPSQASDKGWGAGYNQAVKEQRRQIDNYLKK